MPPFAGGEPAGRNWASSVHGFKLLFGTRGQYDTGFEKCMLPGNINDRIVVFANKHRGFEGQLFSKTGQMEGENRGQRAEVRGRKPDHGTTDHGTQTFELQSAKTQRVSQEKRKHLNHEIRLIRERRTTG